MGGVSGADGVLQAPIGHTWVVVERRARSASTIILDELTEVDLRRPAELGACALRRVADQQVDLGRAHERAGRCTT